MKTKPCKYCGEEIAKNAKKCPKCGGKYGLPKFVKFLIIVAIIIICIVGCVGGCSKSVSDAIDETENSYKDVNGKTSFKINETFENKYIKMTMTEINQNFTDYNSYTSVKDGYKIIAIKFEAENIGDRDEYVSYIDMKCYADDVAMDTNYLVFDKYDDLSETISSGKKATGYVFYEVPKNAEKIVVEYEPSWIDNNKVEFIIK